MSKKHYEEWVSEAVELALGNMIPDSPSDVPGYVEESNLTPEEWLSSRVSYGVHELGLDIDPTHAGYIIQHGPDVSMDEFDLPSQMSSAEGRVCRMAMYILKIEVRERLAARVGLD